MSVPPATPPFAAAARLWLVIGCISFGGAAGQIALLHRLVVEERRWIAERCFLEGLDVCMLLPGPEAQQLATYLGWRLHGVAGGLVAGGLFVLPGAVLMGLLAALYGLHGRLPAIEALFFGLKGAVVAIVAAALGRIARRALHGPAAVGLAVAAFLALFALNLPFPLVVLGAGAFGLAAGRLGRGWFAAAPGKGTEGEAVSPAAARAAQRAGTVALAIWIAAVAACARAGGVFGDIAVFFAKMAVAGFGGAYAVLAWVAQDAVQVHGWISPAEMVDGLALAETTPGPTILVLQFVAHLAAFREAGPWAGVAGGALAVFVTFGPSFAWIFLVGPVMGRIAARRDLASALAAITAAVVGVIAHLALVLALPVLFGGIGRWRAGPLELLLPLPASLDARAALVVAAGFAALFGLRLGLAGTLGLCALLGLLLGFAP